MIIFSETYSSESLSDLERDITECLSPSYNPIAAQIPKDEDGFHTGSFLVTVQWVPDSE